MNKHFFRTHVHISQKRTQSMPEVQSCFCSKKTHQKLLQLNDDSKIFHVLMYAYIIFNHNSDLFINACMHCTFFFFLIYTRVFAQNCIRAVYFSHHHKLTSMCVCLAISVLKVILDARIVSVKTL